VWAAGVVTWEVFTGRRLFKADGDLASMLRIITTDPPPLEQVCPGVPSSAADAVRAALARDRDERCATARELRTLLLGSPPRALASAEEVAEYVRRTAGRALEGREAHIAEFERLREQRRAATETAHDAALSSSSDALAAGTATSRRTAAALAGLALVAATGAAYGLWQARRPAPSSSPASVVAGSSIASPPPALATGAASAPSEAKDNVLRISANAPIAQLKISGRVVSIEVPANRIDVEAPARGFSIEAISTDGRRATFVSLVRAQDATLAFPKRKVAGGAPAPPRSSAPLPLSPSPYGK
jgi:serine/threonine-protein kinase